MVMSDSVVRPELLVEYCAAALRKVGMSDSDAQVAAEIMVTADMRGTASHGTVALRTYIKEIQQGGINPKAEPEAVTEAPAWMVLDGQAGLGVLVAYKSAQMAMRKARESGIAAIAVRNSNHFAAAGYYSLMMAQSDMIGLAMANAAITLAVTGAAGQKNKVVHIGAFNNPCS
jgi:LDH2 family malate/lactate/ureidoglycolate dehydrogenase